MPTDELSWDDKIKGLPQDVKIALSADETSSTIQSIAKTHNLHIDIAGKLTDAVSAVFFGKLAPQNFVSEIQKTMSLDQESAITITKEVNEKIFLPIRESLKKIHTVGEVSAPRENAPLEKKRDVLQAIEAPELVPMNTRIIESTLAKPEPLTIIPPEPTPIPVAAPVTQTPTAVRIAPQPPVLEVKIEVPQAIPAAPIVPPTPIITPPVAPTPTPIAVPPVTPTPEIKKEIPAAAPTAPAPQKAAFDPYREAAA